MNKIISELYDKIDAQDKIINEQALEIARLNKRLNCKEKLTKIMPPDTEFIILSKSDYERQEKDIEEIALELRDRIDKAIEYIKENKYVSADENCEIIAGWRIDELLEILGDEKNDI